LVVRPDRDAKDPPVIPLLHRHLAIIGIATLPLVQLRSACVVVHAER